ncbi:MAG: type II toxin-antitoxin system RatA family toxin [Gammaproteobacteria bacterium]|nr:type II toxin-antitoxin system RatA family toxin [Gammaproteobacteria bacterium]
MREVNRSALVGFPAQAMFDLVNDVARYPEFLPWCKRSEVLESSDSHMLASIEIAKGGFNRAFTTRNTLTPGERIELALVDGPFKELAGSWHFQALSDDACKVSLHLEFKFASRMLEMMLGPVFNQICDTMLDSFVRRAQVVYGNKAGA